MKLHSYTNEIIDIAAKNGASYDIGADMFLANIRNAGNTELPHYGGADQVDFAILKADLIELTNSKPYFVLDYKKHSKEIIALRNEGNYEKVKEIMEAEAEK